MTARVEWDGERLRRKLRDLEEGDVVDVHDLYANIDLVVDGESVTGDPLTFCRYFFTQLFNVFKYLDPARLGDVDLHMDFGAGSEKNQVGGEGFEFEVTELDDDVLQIKYLPADAGEYSTVETSFPAFVEGVLDSCERFIEQVSEVDEEFLDHKELRELREEKEIVEAWYEERWG